MFENISDSEALIWKFLDGQCTEKEQNWINAQLQQDASFQELYNHCMKTHKSLQGIEYESPSVRFVQNVMEAIPQVSTRVYNRLIPVSFWKWGIVSVIIIVTISLVTSSLASMNADVPFFNKIAGQMGEFQNQPAMKYAYWTSIAVCALLILDYFHRWRTSFR